MPECAGGRAFNTSTLALWGLGQHVAYCAALFATVCVLEMAGGLMGDTHSGLAKSLVQVTAAGGGLCCAAAGVPCAPCAAPHAHNVQHAWLPVQQAVTRAAHSVLLDSHAAAGRGCKGQGARRRDGRPHRRAEQPAARDRCAASAIL